MADGLNGDVIARMLRTIGARTTGLIATPDKIADLFNDAMLRYGDGLFTTRDRVAALLSEAMVESAWFQTTTEYSSRYQSAYKPYIGRTGIQITWKANYSAFGKWCKAKGLIGDADHFVKHPADLSDLKWFALGPVWYFTHVRFSGKLLVEFAGNIRQVGRAVNNGNPYTTYAARSENERVAAYNAVRSLGNAIIPKPPPGQVKDSGSKDVVKTTHIDIDPTKGEIHTKFGTWGPYWGTNRGQNKQHPTWGQHVGDDWHRNAGAAEQGDPIYAIAPGRVIFAGKSSGGLGWGPAFGYHVLITSKHKLPGEDFYRTTLYAHMSKPPKVRYGQDVDAGDVIGTKGKTGNVTGVHLHLEQHAGQGWGDRKLKPVYPGKTITQTIEQEGAPVMAKPAKFNRTKATRLKKSKYFHTIPINNEGTGFSATTGPGTVYVVADIETDVDCWARFVTVNKKGAKKVSYATRYQRVRIKAGGDQITLYDTIGGPAKGWDKKLVRLQILAYNGPVTVKSVSVRAGKEI